VRYGQGKEAVDKDVRIPPDGRGKVCVALKVKGVVMPLLRARVLHYEVFSDLEDGRNHEGQNLKAGFRNLLVILNAAKALTEGLLAGKVD